ncbi:MAG: hypothetical protein APF82_01095 [Sphingomonadales bacterium BRH_c42]|nr:MAG: hypothetical protein APF82_01095 [Sphingomonadales bacterium BRH_c42]
MPIVRRKLLAGAGVAAVAAVAVPTVSRWVGKSTSGAGYRTLTSAEAAILGDLGEALVPGARAAGLAYYIDHHISVPTAQSLLMLRYLDVAPPFARVYQAALAALARVTGGRSADWDAIAISLADGSIARWTGAPPPQLFYFALRADAIDVVYGTEAGFERLGVPYLPHIEPDPRW